MIKMEKDKKPSAKSVCVWYNFFVSLFKNEVY